MSSNRISRKDFIVPRCTSSCPAGIDVPRYIRAVNNGLYGDALAVIREKIPFPTVCADACFAPCEDACAYRQYGDPIAIRALKRTAVEEGDEQWKENLEKASSSGKKVAIVGAGPAGLTAAYYLALAGHAATVYDAFPEPGGMMRYGIPEYRLPESRLKSDIDEIMALGVEFKGGVNIGEDLSLEELTNEFDAVFIASGANSSAQIPLEGRDKSGVLWGWEFLKDVSLGNAPEINGKVAVVGGGNVALDVALTAKRLGATEVNVVCLETREEMPAHPWEIKLAEEEGVHIYNAWAPKTILGEDSVVGLGMMKCTSCFDGACNFNPTYDDLITHKVDAETVILAIGQSPVLEFAKNGVDVAQNLIVANDTDLSTSNGKVFAGGDVVTGPQSIIDAIAQGRLAADSMDRFLGGSGVVQQKLAPAEDEVWLAPMERVIRSRNEMAHLAPWERVQGFDQVEQSLTPDQIKAESSRCLDCDVRAFDVVLDIEKCKECGYCVEVCDMGIFGPAANFNVKGYRPMEVKNTDWCVGCFKCFFSCPDFAIDVRELTA